MNKLIIIIGCILLSIMCISCDVYGDTCDLYDSCDSCNLCNCNNIIKNDSSKKLMDDDDDSWGPTISTHVGYKPGSYGPAITLGGEPYVNDDPGELVISFF